MARWRGVFMMSQAYRSWGEEQDDGCARAGEDEREDDSGQRRVRERIAQQPLAPEHRVGAQHAADDAEQHRAERDVPQRVVEEQIMDDAHDATRSSSRSFSRFMLPP